MNPPVALTIAGSDSGGGAGVQADLKTFAAHRVFGTSVITALTAQNTVGVRAISAVDPQFVAAQLEAVLDDLPVAAVKTGMLATPETVALVARFAPRLPGLVVDPVLVASSGDRLFTVDAERAYLELLFPHAAVVTPNLREASVLLGRDVLDADDAVKAAADLAAFGPRCVVVKGGHLWGSAKAVDAVWFEGQTSLMTAPWISTPNNHGTGCTFAAATTALLASGAELPAALDGAKTYVHAALRRSTSWSLGAGHGPLGWGPF
ncbi:bifunctional hydroxymethylpyrimidine kinase/phosphomethylpyrimidine kinase [Dactylosporangium sp. NPDC051541]|uniref:bifunctional hydroxymethylpyrimidine kinase/phosphomethylpyrimidine kinase n=1 Tax=Dactylosporangium sp. NPDC051541 TaxID=3363977 RepID=UPI0037A82712